MEVFSEASAFLIVRENKIILNDSVYIGKTTNNSAEYRAIMYALKAANKYSRGLIHVYSDNNLVINQIKKQWKINYPHLSKLFNQLQKLCANYERVDFFNVIRNNPYIQKCDKLCNDRLDAEGFKN